MWLEAVAGIRAKKHEGTKARKGAKNTASLFLHHRFNLKYLILNILI
jgi:hypothetical protein